MLILQVIYFILLLIVENLGKKIYISKNKDGYVIQQLKHIHKS